MSTKEGKKYLDKNGLSYFRKKLKEEQLWEQGENIDGGEGGVQIAYYGNAVGEASVSEGVSYNYKKSLDEIIPISIKSLSSSEKASITNYMGNNHNYNYVFKIDFSSIDDPEVSSLYKLCNKAFNLSLCEYVENTENTSVSELAIVKKVNDISYRDGIINIFADQSDFSQLEISNSENLEWGLLELDEISVNKNSTYIIGISTGAFGIASHSEGYYTTANGDYSHSEGDKTCAEGSGSHAEGSGSIGIGNYSHAEGLKTRAEGPCSHSEGNSSEAVGNASHAEGIDSHAKGSCSHAEGTGSSAEGDGSHAEGYKSQAKGGFSHTEGYHTITTNTSEHAEGEYNKSNTGTRSSIGIGSSTLRKNAFEVMQNGDIYVHGLGDYDGTNAVVKNSEGKIGQSLQDYISDIELTPGPGLEYDWNGTQLGVRKEGDENFVYTDLIGPTGINGLTIKGTVFPTDVNQIFPTGSKINDAYLIGRDSLSGEYPENSKKGDLWVCVKESEEICNNGKCHNTVPEFNFVGNLCGPTGSTGETGKSILFYDNKITTDTNNKANIPTGFSVRVGDLVIDENFNLYKCIEE